MALTALIAGCGKGDRPRTAALEFETLADTVGLTQGAPLLESFEPIRFENGLMRVHAKLRFPDGTRVQLSVYPASGTRVLARMQIPVKDGSLEFPPFLGERGPLPRGRYRFELLTYFNPSWQPPEVLEATDHGRNLRGPGMMRASMHEAAFLLNREQTL